VEKHFDSKQGKWKMENRKKKNYANLYSPCLDSQSAKRDRPGRLY